MSDDQIEFRLLQLLPLFVGRLPDADLKNAENLIRHREWGVGLEVLCAQLDEYEVELSAGELSILNSFANELGVDVSYLGI